MPGPRTFRFSAEHKARSLGELRSKFPGDPPVLTLKQAAKQYRLGLSTLYFATGRPETDYGLPGARLGRDIFIVGASVREVYLGREAWGTLRRVCMTSERYGYYVGVLRGRMAGLLSTDLLIQIAAQAEYPDAWALAAETENEDGIRADILKATARRWAVPITGWMRAGRLPAIKVGQQWVFLEEDARLFPPSARWF